VLYVQGAGEGVACGFEVFAVGAQAARAAHLFGRFLAGAEVQGELEVSVGGACLFFEPPLVRQQVTLRRRRHLVRRFYMQQINRRPKQTKVT